ncbi:hypothetical protein K432DRAFT_379219 [Lepidopterella palustris CBS 459.81]|uniref:Uncharacterized protein n=1 Tax=Lepidopterella palustris CBS 459.81 TaxID=1314670 RepID=A0A8E2EGU4_9PEZI|nr:hypothetical protein K432DRAFT_379219 [Lepidopterella palustris CBS 459.81]
MRDLLLKRHLKPLARQLKLPHYNPYLFQHLRLHAQWWCFRSRRRHPCILVEHGYRVPGLDGLDDAQKLINSV